MFKNSNEFCPMRLKLCVMLKFIPDPHLSPPPHKKIGKSHNLWPYFNIPITNKVVSWHSENHHHKNRSTLAKQKCVPFRRNCAAKLLLTPIKMRSSLLEGASSQTPLSRQTQQLQMCYRMYIEKLKEQNHQLHHL